jgi:hypothetical protein
MFAKILRRIVSLTPSLFVFPALFIFQLPAFGKPAAVVASLTGDASAFSPSARAAAAIHALDWLDAGVRIEVHPKSTLRLIMVSGRAYELGEGAKATLSADTLTAFNSQVRELKSLPPIPRVPAIATTAADVPGATAIRGGSRVKNLYPHHAAAIASHVKLRFESLPDASSYTVTLEDDEGNALLRVSTPATSVEVPADALKPASHYSWRVRAFGDSGVLGEGGAQFVTLSTDDIDRRAAFRSALSIDDAATRPEDAVMRLALIAGVDQQIGLLSEACDEFQTALGLRPSDPVVQRALAGAQAALAAATDK